MKIIFFLFTFLAIFFFTPAVDGQSGIELVSRIGNGWDTAKAISIRDNYAYIATGVSGLQIVDISNPDSLYVVGFLDDMPGYASDIALRDNYALLANDNAGLAIIDIEDPEHPVEYANCNNIGVVTKISLSETHAFLACLDSGFAVVDITDMTDPQFCRFISVEDMNLPSDVYVYGNYALLCVGYYGLRIIDISNPDNLVEIETDGIGDANSITIRDNMAFTVGSSGSAGGNILIFDISDFENWEYMGSLFIWNKANSISLYENKAYCLGDRYGPFVSVVDISNPEEPELLTNDYSNYQPTGMAISGGLGFVSMGGYWSSPAGFSPYWAGDVGVLDLSVTDSLSWINHLEPIEHPSRVKMVGNIAFSLSTSSNLHCYNISDPEAPELLSIYENDAQILDFDIRDTLIFITDKTKLSVVDVSDPENPYMAARWIFANGIFARRINIHGNYAYINSSPDNLNDILYIFDVEDFNFLNYIRSIRLHRDFRSPKVYIYSDRMYIADQRSCDIYDITNPEHPVQTDIIIRSTSSCAFKEDHIFTAYENRIIIRSLANPDTIVPVDTLYTRSDISDLTISGNYLYVAESMDGFEIYNVEDIENCHPVGWYDTPGGVLDLSVFEQYVLVADWTNLGIYNCSQALQVERDVTVHSPKAVTLNPGFPNPFNSEVTIQYQLPQYGFTRLSIVDPSGRNVERVFEGNTLPGSYSQIWNAKTYPSGIYFAVLEANSSTLTRKLVLVR